MLWPAARLNDSTRYVVAFRGLLNENNEVGHGPRLL